MSDVPKLYSVRAPVRVRYQRARGDRQRQRLLALVSANPGIHVLRAASLLGINWNTCHHHVRRLEAQERVSVVRAGGALCLFDRRQGAATPRVALRLLQDERNGALVELVLAAQGQNQRALADRLGLAASVVHRRLKQLEQAGLVRRVARGREVAVFGTERLLAVRERAALPAASLIGLEAAAGGGVASGVAGAAGGFEPRLFSTGPDDEARL